VFAWHKGKFGCCKIGEHVIDTHGFPQCCIAPSGLSFWEEAKVKRQIDALVALRKMTPNSSKYVCKVTLLMKKDDIAAFVEIIGH
jgi:hypothetical protein